MNHQLPDRSAGRRMPGSLSSGQRSARRRALVFASWFVVVSPLVTRPATSAAAETGWNSSLFLAQTQPKTRSARDRLGRPRASQTGPAASPRTPDQPDDANDAAGDQPADARSDTSPGGFRSIVRAIRKHAVWIVVVLVCAIGGVLVWVLMGRTSGGAFEEELDDADLAASPTGAAGEKRSRYSTTKIQAREVNDRLEVDSTQVETDREYALVVDEEALKKPEVDERTGQVYADSSDIEDLLEERRFDEAYDTYAARIGGADVVEFHSEVERALSEHYLSSRDFERAAHILEHHVATHAAEDISPDTYFNLGYVHFFSQKVKKSRRFLKLYVEREGNSARAARARRILEVLEDASAS